MSIYGNKRIKFANIVTSIPSLTKGLIFNVLNWWTEFVSKFTVKGVGRETEKKNARCYLHSKVSSEENIGEIFMNLGYKRFIRENTKKEKPGKKKKW